MKKSVFVLALVLILSGVFFAGGALAQKAPPPITYPGDTGESISRRAQWLEEAKKEGALNWWGVLVGDSGVRLVAEFNKLYPAIKVHYWRGSAEEIASKLEAEFRSGRYSADVVLGGNPINYQRWRKTGIMERYVKTITWIRNLDKRMYGRYDDWASVGFTPSVPTYNTKKVLASEAPKSWDDLLDRKWKGKIGSTLDVKTWNVFALEEGGWGIEKTEDFLGKLKQQEFIVTQSKSTGQSLLIAGEFPLFTDGYIPMTLKAQEQEAPIDWCRISPIIVTGSSFVLSSKAPHPNAAKLFLEWLFSPQGLQIYETITSHGAVFPGSGTRLAKALEGLTLIFRTEEGEIKANEMGLDKKFANILGAIAK